MDYRFLVLGVVFTVIVAIWIEAYLKRNRPKKSLGERLKPNFGVEEDEHGQIKKPLGMEATDMSIIHESERLNPNIDHRDPRLKRIKRKKEAKHD